MLAAGEVGEVPCSFLPSMRPTAILGSGTPVALLT